MAEAQRNDWWARNWKWFVPVVCLSGLALIGGFVALVMFFVFGMMKSSDAYQQALAKAKADPAVIRALGNPIREGFFVTGSINVSGASGDADLAIPIAGAKGKGTIYVEARRSAGQWSFSQLAVQVDQTDERIELLDEHK